MKYPVLIFLFLGAAASTADEPPAKRLSSFNLFESAPTQAPAPGILPYDLNTPLFSDYSTKHRFVFLPPGTSARYRDSEPFEFPVGTILVKTFGFLHDLRDPAKGEQIIETRLLIRQEQGWIGLPYIWDKEVKEARLAVAGGRREVSWIHYDGSERRINYIVPNMNQCKQCHEQNGKLEPIGPRARHLNRDLAYADGERNQLQHWQALGLLTGAPDNAADLPRAPVAEDPATGTLDARARAYLDINCAHCHNLSGPAHMSGLNLSILEQNPHRLGVLKPPVAAGRGAGEHRFGIVPGKPEESILLHRMESTDPGVMMPQLPRQTVHEEGVKLIREWISEMQGGE